MRKSSAGGTSSNTSTLGGWGNLGTAFGSFTQRTGVLSTILNVGGNTPASSAQSNRTNEAEEVSTADKELSKSSETLVDDHDDNDAQEISGANPSAVTSTSTVPQQIPHQQQLHQEGDTSSIVASSMGAQHSVNTTLSNRSPDDVSKEELLEILSKMSKRVKALNAVRLQLQEKYTKVDNDKSRLLSLLKEEILSEVDITDASNQAEVGNKGTE